MSGDNDRTRPLHNSPACICLFCWGEIERLRAAGDALVDALDGSRNQIRAAAHRWNEARRD